MAEQSHKLRPRTMREIELLAHHVDPLTADLKAAHRGFWQMQNERDTLRVENKCLKAVADAAQALCEKLTEGNPHAAAWRGLVDALDAFDSAPQMEADHG